MPRKATTQLTEFHWHEALDRTFVVMELLERIVLDHDVIRSTPALKRQAETAHRHLNLLYQKVGRMDPERAGAPGRPSQGRRVR